VVRLAGPEGELVATVESTSSATPARLTCSALHPAHVREWRLVSLEPAGR
jgi:hypothetical protein